MQHRFLPRNWVNSRNRFAIKRLQRLIGLGLLSSIVLLFSLLLINVLKLPTAASGPVDAFFVLGGTLRREIHVADLAKQYPETRILISQGSKDPCNLLVFQRAKAPIHQVWLERCADSTFDNFYFNISLLQQWRVRKVRLITSTSHVPRAKWMAQILLGAHGIWVEPDITADWGIPKHPEFPLKTGLDVARSLVWALLSQVIQPQCSKVMPLSVVDVEAWRKRGRLKCEPQSGLKLD